MDGASLDKEAMDMYTKLFNGELTDNPDFNGSHCSAVADGTIYYGTISYSCPCLIKQPGNTRYDKEEPTFKPDSKICCSNQAFTNIFQKLNIHAILCHTMFLI